MNYEKSWRWKQKTRQCWNKIKPDCVYLKCASWDLHHTIPVEVLNFGGAEKWISLWGIFSGGIQIVVREVSVTHSSHRCTNHSQQCQQGRILFSIFCRSTHLDNTSSSVSAQAIFQTMLHIMPSRTTMDARETLCSSVLLWLTIMCKGGFNSMPHDPCQPWRVHRYATHSACALRSLRVYICYCFCRLFVQESDSSPYRI